MEIISKLQPYELAIVLAIGLAAIFFGYRIKKVAFFIIWFLLGFMLVNYFMPEIIKISPQIAENSLWQSLLPVGGGLLLALLGFSIEKLCVSGICFALVMLITIQYFGTQAQILAIGGVIGIVVAGASTMLMKPATIVATSAAGAYALTIALLALFPQIDQTTYYFPMIIGFAVLGSVFQFLTTKRIN